MQLSKFTDYTFRVLLYMGSHPQELCTVEKLAVKLEVSEHHLKKVIHKLAKTEFLIATKGRTGGLKLGLPPEQINLGEVLRLTDDNLTLLECIKNETTCNFLSSECKLKGVISRGMAHFIDEFGRYTLQDIL